MWGPNFGCLGIWVWKVATGIGLCVGVGSFDCACVFLLDYATNGKMTRVLHVPWFISKTVVIKFPVGEYKIVHVQVSCYNT